MILRSDFLEVISMSTCSPIYDAKGHPQALTLTCFRD